MSKQADLIFTLLQHCKKYNIKKKDAVDFVAEVLQDAGQIETSEDGDISAEDRIWLTKLAERELEF